MVSRATAAAASHCCPAGERYFSPPTGQSVRYTKDYNNPKQPRHFSESRIAQWARSRVRDSTRCIARVRSSPVSLFYFILFTFFFFFFFLSEVEVYSLNKFKSCESGSPNDNTQINQLFLIDAKLLVSLL